MRERRRRDADPLDLDHVADNYDASGSSPLATLRLAKLGKTKAMSDPIDPRRRHALALMSALGVGTLAGCTLGHETRDAEAGAEAAGELILPRISLPSNSIDVHTHFFNASDASVVGYFTHSVNHDDPNLERFLERMEGVLKALVGTAPSARMELDQLKALHAQKLSPDGMEAILQLQEEAERTRIAREIARQMRESGVTNDFGKGFESNKGFQSVPTDERDIRALLDPDSEESNKSLVSRGAQVAGAFRFMGCMLQRRSTSLRTFRRGHGGRGISAAFGALVDFDHFYSDLARSPLSDQIQLHSLLARDSQGFMLPLVAYNPWADMKSGGARLKLVTEAVEKHGFIGAKIYPPVGFRPTGNVASIPGLEPRELDATLKGFFLECNRLGIPVMAHANSTQGRDFEADQNSRPEGWQALIEEMAKDGKVPVINLGHFGGNGGEGPKETSNDWPRRFAELMGKSGGEGVHGDLGNWTALRECRTGGKKCVLARERLAEAKLAYPKIDQRLMYGSDWFMMVKEVAWKRWPEDIASAMSGTGFDLQRLFHQNAMECFGLLPGGANRARLEAFFGGKLPGWMV
jgi:hypothetical protein